MITVSIGSVRCQASRTRPRPARPVSLFLLTAAAALVGCGPGEREARETIGAFLAGVQNQDRARLYCLMTGARDADELAVDPADRRAAFEQWVGGMLEAYDWGRDHGQVELDEHGVVASKLFALGKGTFFELSQVVHPAEDVMRVRMELRFGYAAVDLSGFSPGTTFYVCGVPLGRVHAIRKPPGGGEESADVLDRLTLEWTLVRSPAGEVCPAGWTVATVVPLPETIATKRITWVF
ncbi:MAG TPA: hypothetical protein VD788_15005 [Candidatus Polarisedimenticolaceae bacterium]|nr:hypothetical protein [Candidatus Polarisedimenticolaceae bacterium]